MASLSTAEAADLPAVTPARAARKDNARRETCLLAGVLTSFPALVGLRVEARRLGCPSPNLTELSDEHDHFHGAPLHPELITDPDTSSRPGTLAI